MLDRRGSVYGVLGFLVLFAVWQIVGSSRLAGPTVPSPSEVWAVYLVPWKLTLLSRAARSTAISAVIGLAAGCVLGLTVAILAHLAVPLQRGLDQLSVVVNAVPAIALGPILIVTVGRDWTPAALATIPVFFVIYVSVSSGLRTANPRLMDALTVLGASRLSRLIHLEAPCALPAFLGGVRIGVTAAIVGAIIGEWFGASTGLGTVILNTMLNFQIPLMWATVLFASSISLCVYAMVGVCEQYVRRRFT
jgi:ABC-type nitrate/sulfonate/bicarbonate transport system permease component